MPCEATWEASGQSEAEGMRDRTWTRVSLVASMGKARQGRVNSLGLASLNYSGGLQAIVVSLVAWYLNIVEILAWSVKAQ